MPRSDLPFGSEFSPAQIDLPVLLEFAHTHGTDWKAFELAVRDRYFADHKTSAYNKGKLANNCKLSLRAYGLVGEKDTTLTPVGLGLFELRGSEPELYKAFARHILRHCQGMNFVQCVLDMEAAGESIDLNTSIDRRRARPRVPPRDGRQRVWNAVTDRVPTASLT